MEAQGYIEYAISKIQANKLKNNNNVTAKEKKSDCTDQSTKPKYIKEKTRVSFKKHVLSTLLQVTFRKTIV